MFVYFWDEVFMAEREAIADFGLVYELGWVFVDCCRTSKNIILRQTFTVAKKRLVGIQRSYGTNFALFS